eukprot:COSAG01_NODE_2260_length_8057_cov_50.825527_3_plen_269_part_00
MPTTVIIDPKSGEHATCPPESKQWTSAVALLKAHNVTAIGYVNSQLGLRPLANYSSEIRAYCNCWAESGLSGIFVDNVAFGEEFMPHYTAVVAQIVADSAANNRTMKVWFNMQNYDYVHHRRAVAYEGFLSIADVLVQFESPDGRNFQEWKGPPVSIDKGVEAMHDRKHSQMADTSLYICVCRELRCDDLRQSYVQKYNPFRCSAIVTNVSSQARMEAIVTRVIRGFGCGWVIALPHVHGAYTNPQVPQWWSQEIATVAGASSGSVPL